MHEIHRLESIAEYGGTHSGIDAFHPSDQYLCVLPMNIHPRPVHIEIAQRDVWQAIHVVETAEQSLVKGLRCTVQRAIIVGMMALLDRKVLRHAIYRCR